ncbi:MAG: hypothetical protein HGA67_04355 [Candidatus Yonathbacteria bacterium]|nr:hypothetical protein [Candidatus Yonathbacteria bacterium]
MSFFSHTITYVKSTRVILFGIVTLLLVASLGIPAAFADVMGSTSYRMRFDSVNIGGNRATSSAYHEEDTVGEVATGDGASANYRVHAGYQQMDASSISISAGSDITMTALSMAQNSAVGNTSWTVITDDAAGYGLSVHASTDPALSDVGTGESFADYTESTPGTPETWSVSSAYEFGFSARGTDVSAGTWGTDTDCLNTADVPSATLKWRGFDGVNNVILAGSSVRTLSTGTGTTLCVATTQAGVFAPSGTYTATVTATAVAN